MLLFSLLTIGATADAEEPAIKVQISSPQVYIDSQLTVVITVERTTEDVGDATPVFDQTDDFTISGPTPMRGSRSTRALVDGVLRQSERFYASYQFEFRPTREGDLEVPSASLRVDGQQYRTNPVQVQAIPPPKADFATLRILPERVAAYVGQAIRISIEFESSQMPRGTCEFLGDTLPRGIIATPGTRQPTTTGEAVSVPIFGIEGYAFLSPDSTGRGTAFSMPLCLIAETPGTRTLGPVSFVVTDNPRLSREKYSVGAPPVTLEIRPLPEQGLPAAFDGIVGPCSIDAAISSSTARVGDPLTLTVRVRGDLPPDRLTAPRIDLQSDVAGGFRLAPEGWVDGGVSGDAHFYSMTIRPLRADMVELPPIELHWFDPESSAYRVSKSRALPLKVEASREVTAADAIGRRSSPVERTVLAETPLRMAANVGGEDRLTDRSMDLSTAWESPWRSVLMLGPPVAWSAIAGLGAWIRSRDPRAVHRRRLTRRSLSAARRARHKPELAGVAARCFVAAHSGLQPESITSADGEALLADLSDPSAKVVLGALRDDEAATYHGRSLHATEELSAAIRRLGTHVRRSQGGDA